MGHKHRHLWWVVLSKMFYKTTFGMMEPAGSSFSSGMPTSPLPRIFGIPYHRCIDAKNGESWRSALEVEESPEEADHQVKESKISVWSPGDYNTV